MFYDTARIFVKAGDGGDGCVSFRREKYVPEGGPNGGDGGRGGNIVFVVDEGLRTLVDFKYKRHYKAERGQHGQGQNKHGRDGKDLILRIPPGTVIKDGETGETLVDLTSPNSQAVLVRGGRGGRGNARFLTNRQKAPLIREKGEQGEERWLTLELKLLADVGLLGLPNAGKSTLISRVSAAKPKIADYPFTTLVPNLGVVSFEDGESFVMADIPGLVEGAHEGVGLGHGFLRHLERTKVLIHLLDPSNWEYEPVKAFNMLNRELNLYSKKLSEKPQIIAINKIDLPNVEEQLTELKKELPREIPLYPISAVTGEGIDELLFKTREILSEIDEETTEDDEFLWKETVHTPEKERFAITVEDGVFIISGEEPEKHVYMTDMENKDAVRRLQRIFTRMGIDDALRAAGARDGDEVRIGSLIFDFVEPYEFIDE